MAAVTDAYATAQEYRDGLSPQKIDTSSDTQILADLTAVSRWLDRRLGRFFTKDAAAVSRDFYGPSAGPVYPEAENPYKFAGKASRSLHLLDSDLVSISALATDDSGSGTPTTTWAATDYQLLPLNADKGSEPNPFQAIYVPEWSTKLGWPPARLVRVTGIWGWPSVPPAIKSGTINITAILRLDSPRAITSVDSIGTAIAASKDARGIVDDLVRMYLKVSY